MVDYIPLNVEPPDPNLRSLVEESEWREALTHVEELGFGGAFRQRAELLRKKGREQPARVLDLLVDVFSYALRHDSQDDRFVVKNGPFMPRFIDEKGRRSALPEDLNDSDLDYLSEILAGLAAGVYDALVARLGDVLWICRKDHKAARRGAKAYLAGALTLEAEGEALGSPSLFRRGLRLAATVDGRAPHSLHHIGLDRILLAAKERPPDRTRAHAVDLLDILLDEGYADPAHLASFARLRAEESEQVGDIHAAKGFWKRTARAHRTAGNAKEADTAHARVAECLVGLAEEHPGAMGAASYLESAIKAYRAIPGSGERREELHAQLLEVQGEQRKELGVISHEVDLEEWPERARTSVSGLEFIAALFELAIVLVHLNDPGTAKEQAIEGARQSPFMFFVPSTTMNNEGRTIARAPGALDDAEGALHAQMQRDVKFGRHYAVASVIRPARLQIWAEHNPSADDLHALTAQSVFVPPGRSWAFARGLAAGFDGDFILSAHLLVPQVEHALRVALIRNTGVHVDLVKEATQPRFSLNQTLYDPLATSLANLFGADIVFDLRSLLVDSLGPNLRNCILHGLIHDGAGCSDMEYLWALALRLCSQSYMGEPPDGFQRSARPPTPDSSEMPPQAVERDESEAEETVRS